MLFAIALLAATVQTGSVAVEVPDTWTHVYRGDVTKIAPSDLKADEVFFLEIFPSEPAASPKDWLDSAWAAFKQGYSGINEQPARASEVSPGYTLAVASAGMLDAKGGSVFATLMGAAHAGRIVPVVTIAGSAETYQAHLAEATAIVSSIQLRDPPPAPPKTLFAARSHAYHGGPAGGAAAPASAPASGARKLDAAGLVGDWGTSSLGGGELYDLSTGAWSEPTGAGMLWSFKSDGTYTHASVLSSGSFSCVVKSFFFDSGRWSLAGDTLTVVQKVSRQRLRNTCGNPQKDVSPTPVTIRYPIRLARDQWSGDLQIILRDPDPQVGELSFPRVSPGGATAPDADVLEGDWAVGGLPVRNLYNAQVGAWGPEMGNQQAITFGSDGSYSRASILVNMADPMCETVVYSFDSGTFRAQGNQLTLTPSRARERTQTCRSDTVRELEPKPTRGPVKVDKDPLLGAARVTFGGVSYIRVVPR